MEWNCVKRGQIAHRVCRFVDGGETALANLLQPPEASHGHFPLRGRSRAPRCGGSGCRSGHGDWWGLELEFGRDGNAEGEGWMLVLPLQMWVKGGSE